MATHSGKLPRLHDNRVVAGSGPITRRHPVKGIIFPVDIRPSPLPWGPTGFHTVLFIISNVHAKPTPLDNHWRLARMSPS